MSSKASMSRKRMKEMDPAGYELYKEKERIRSRERRARKKEKWENGPRTPAMIEEKLHELELTRQRQIRYQQSKAKSPRQLRRQHATVGASPTATPTSTRRAKLKEMTMEAVRMHKANIKSLWRSKLSSQKKTAIRLKDRAYQRRRRQAARLSREPKDNPTPARAWVPLSKKLYNLTSGFRKKLTKSTKNDSGTYAQVIRNLATPTSPSKRRAIRKLFATPKNGGKSRRKRAPSIPLMRIRQGVKVFFHRYDISRQLPHKRYATKWGPGYVMNMTLRGAYDIYRLEHDLPIMSYAQFCKLRPRNVRKLGSVAMETCLCMYCLNVRYKIDAINRLFQKEGLDQRLPHEGKFLEVLLCQREEGSRWHRPECVLGECPTCQDPAPTLNKICEPVRLHTINWTHWERMDGRLDVQTKTAPLETMLEEFLRDLNAPVKGTTFAVHIFTAHWQYSQYVLLKETLKEGEVLMVMDFAENRKAMFSNEVKSAHFGKSQITLHPVVMFYRGSDLQLVRHSIMFLSDDIQHDYHAVNHFTVSAITTATSSLGARKIYIFSDGCASQYKGRGTFADLSLLSGCPVQRLYFGSEHGKGEADGETGVFSQAMERTVRGGTCLKNAADLFAWCNKALHKDDPHFKRSFVLVGANEIARERPETEIRTVPGTRKMHQIERVSDFIIKSRRFACLCLCCRENVNGICENRAFCGAYDVIKLQPRNVTVLNNGFLEDEPTVIHDSVPSAEAPIVDGPPNSPGHSSSSSPNVEDSPSTEVPIVDGPPNSPMRPSSSNGQDSFPVVGQYVSLTYEIKRKRVTYCATVINSPVPLEHDEFMVRFMRKMGRHYVFPNVPDESIVALGDLVSLKILEPPRMDNRFHFFFQE